MPNLADCDIPAAFLAALKWHLDGSARGTRSRLASLLGKDPAQITDIVKGRRPTDERARRRIAGFFGAEYETFLRMGAAILDGRDPADAEEAEWKGLTEDRLRERGFISVPFSDNMKLAAGSGGTIPITDHQSTSPVVVYGPSINRRTARNLQAFRVGGDSMEPYLAAGGIVMADISEESRDLDRVREGRIYVLCWDLQEGECAVKFLQWYKKGERVLITSANHEAYPPLIKRADEIQLVGRVIWAWREFD